MMRFPMKRISNKHAMETSLQRFIDVLMLESAKPCIRYGHFWRIMFLVGAVVTTLVIMYQTPTFSSNGFNIFHSPIDQEMDTSFPLVNGSLRSMSRSASRVKGEQGFEVVPSSPVSSVNSSIGIKGQSQTEAETASPMTRKRKRKKIDELVVVESPPTPHHITTPLERHVWSLPPDNALAYARREIEHAPVVTNDEVLYSPLFRNISVFKRSYELMELILKVYIYPDGKKPIFHLPHLTGIYASEGWFMRLMESNRQFVTRNPEKAHLFYMPYSVRQLQRAFYVPQSHNIKTMSIFLRDYVNLLAVKYPFWNRTHGSDHFLVACHDWGPYTVSEHPELKRNAIKALCNADSSEGIFIPGKDVSLPETTIKNSARPLRNIGKGNRVSQRPILAFFAGHLHGKVRPMLLKHWKNKDEDMKIFGPLPKTVSHNMTYIQHMKSSKYCLCPMGYEVNSPRIVEAVYYECVPVIIADNFVLPFSEILNWEAFSVVLAEKDIPRLKQILLSIPLRKYIKMQMNVKMVQKHFLWSMKPRRYDLFHMILHSIWFNRLHQIQFFESE